MKTFQITGDENRIYFQNLERRPAEKELAEALNILKAVGCDIGEKETLPDTDRYEVRRGSLAFRIYFDGTEAVIYVDRKKDAAEIEKIFA